MASVRIATARRFLLLVAALSACCAALAHPGLSRHGGARALSLRRVQRPSDAPARVAGAGPGPPLEPPGFVTDPYRVAYYAPASIGTPPSDVMLVIDTGSGNLAVDSTLCEGCFGASRYDFEHSATAAVLPCAATGHCACTTGCECDPSVDACVFSVSYVDGSGWLAVAVNDTVALPLSSGETSVSGFTVAAKVVQKGGGSFFADNDGTMGWAYGERLSVSGKSWVAAYAAQHGTPLTFSICMGWVQGQLAVGPTSEYADMFASPIQYTPLVDTGYYTVNMTLIEVSKNSDVASVIVYRDPADALGPLLDTGSTLMHFDPTTYDALMHAVDGMCERGEYGWVGICDESARSGGNNWTVSECVRLSARELSEWPTISLVFAAMPGGEPTRVSLAPFEYMNPLYAPEEAPEDAYAAGGGALPADWPLSRAKLSGWWCRGWDEAPLHANINIGDPLFRARAVVHDVHGMRVGFAKPNRKQCF